MKVKMWQWFTATDDSKPEPAWAATVIDDRGKSHDLGPFDHEPTDDELAALVPELAREMHLTAAAPRAHLEAALREQVLEAFALDWWTQRARSDQAIIDATAAVLESRALGSAAVLVGGGESLPVEPIPRPEPTTLDELATAAFARATALTIAWMQAS